MGGRRGGFHRAVHGGCIASICVFVSIRTTSGDLTSRTYRCQLSSWEMDVRQLAALVAIADHGTFSAAARALFTVQSNVSSHIARLERELGTTLVDRAQGGLTEDGARVVDRARRILREMEDIAADVAPVDGNVTGDVRLGILGTTARWLLPRLLSALEAQHPGVRAIVSEGSTSALIPGLLTGPVQRGHHPPPGRRPRADDRAAVRRGPPARDARRPPAGRPGRDAAGRAGHPPPAAAPGRVGPAPGARPGGPVRRRAAPRPGRDRRRPPAGHARRRRPRGHDRAGDGGPVDTEPFGRVRIPELPPAGRRPRLPAPPAPGPPARALFDVLREVLAARATDQPGVRLGTEAFPLARSI